jgi:hypothetical protein
MAVQVEIEAVNYLQFDRRQVRSAMGKASRIIAKNLKSLVSRRAGSGRTYVTPGRSYTASSPGNPPVRLSGALWRSIKGRASRRGYAVVVSAIAPHAYLLELGWRSAAARPAFVPIFERDGVVIENLLRAAVDQGITVTVGRPGQPPKATEIN